MLILIIYIYIYIYIYILYHYTHVDGHSSIMHMLILQDGSLSLDENTKTLLEQPLSVSNYRRRFNVLLDLEEHVHVEKLRK